jgi:acyl-[acyl-carrier-protein]-phospholipid O-acyltransferase/long-chain-fatty-acid--[acyl-carrier-protein] ligase
VPAADKGERLIVLHTVTDEELEELFEKLEKSDLPNLWRPKPSAFYRVEAIPVLGSGKMDIRAVKNLAKQLYAGE